MKYYRCQDEDCGKILEERELFKLPNGTLKCSRCRGKVVDTGVEEADLKNLFGVITKAAKDHGEDSEPDHEVGDLQEALRTAIELLPTQQKIDLYIKLKEKELIPA